MTIASTMPSGVRSSSGTLIPFIAGRLNASASGGTSITIVAPKTASPRNLCPPSSVMTKMAASSDSNPPREYVMPRQHSSRNIAASAPKRTPRLRSRSVVRRSVIGTASTTTSASAFQYCSGSRRREAIAVWLKSSPSTFTAGMTLPASAYSAHASATHTQPYATRSIARGALEPAPIASTTTSVYARPRFSAAHELSGATDHNSVIPHQIAKPASSPTPIHASTGARTVRLRENSQPTAAPTPTSAMPVCSRGSAGTPTAPCAKTAYVHAATSAKTSAVPGCGLRRRAASAPTRVATRALAGVMTAMADGGRC